MKKSHPKKRVSKAEWLDRALKVVESEGVHGVRVERLARDLGIAKAGFYWHFRDRADLLQNVLDHWAHEFTEVITANPEMLEGEPKQRLYQAMLIIMEHDLGKYDLAIRDWAARDPAAAKVVRTVTAMRLDFARSIFSDLGFRGHQVEMRARLFVCYQSMEQNIYTDLSQDERRRLLRLRHKLFVTRSGA